MGVQIANQPFVQTQQSEVKTDEKVKLNNKN